MKLGADLLTFSVGCSELSRQHVSMDVDFMPAFFHCLK
jgi:hypothetical protein